MVENEDKDSLMSTLKSLTCRICNNILSVAPIVTLSSEEYQCGRCKNIKYEDNAVHNKIFEKVAQHLSFPCKNAQCAEVIPWTEVENHERDCIYTTITCPVYHDDCNEKVLLRELAHHMIQKHGNNISYEKIELSVSTFKSHVSVAIVRGLEFLIYICNDKVIITSIAPCAKKLTYNLKLSNTDEKKPCLSYHNQEIERFNETKHCFRCLDKRCDLKHHPFSNFYRPKIESLPNDLSCKEIPKRSCSSKNGVPSNYGGNLFGDPFKPVSAFSSPLDTSFGKSGFFSPNNGFNGNQLAMSSPNSYDYSRSNNEIKKKDTVNNQNDQPLKIISEDQIKQIKCTTFNISNVQNLIGVTPTIIFTITISSNEETEQPDVSPRSESFIPRNLLSTIDNTEIIRKILECPICSELMKDKIYVCERGHQICDKCKTLNATRGTCPSCMGTLADSRSIALESLAEDCSLCCFYKDAGCEYRGNVKRLYNHEKECEGGKNNV